MGPIRDAWVAVVHDAGPSACHQAAFYVTTPCLFGEPLPSSSVRLFDGALLPTGSTEPDRCEACGAVLGAALLAELVARHATERLEDVT